VLVCSCGNCCKESFENQTKESIMQKIYPALLMVGLILTGTTTLRAETQYVTDRILLGVHADPAEESPLLDSVPSGTALEVLETNKSFSKVRLPNGKIGWVSGNYMMKQQPATAMVDQLQAKLQKAETKAKGLQEKLATKERELQVRGDQLSNARTTIKDLNKKGASAAPAVDTKMAEELANANQEIANLKQQLAQQEANKEQVESAASQSIDKKRLATLEQENASLKSRIDLAVAGLTGEQLPDAVEMALKKPDTPGWYWGILVLVLIVGLVAGLVLMDYKYRRRHGGFRV
jgi:SH3 domain protein